MVGILTSGEKVLSQFRNNGHGKIQMNNWLSEIMRRPKGSVLVSSVNIVETHQSYSAPLSFNRCSTKYCDCVSNGMGCDPAVCTCINCENMMKPHSENLQDEIKPEEEDETEVYIPSEVDDRAKIRNIPNFAHLINDFEDRRVVDPSERLKIAYIQRENAQGAAKQAMEEESAKRKEIEQQVAQLEAELGAKLKKEYGALESYRKYTNNVMCLEIQEPSRWNSMYGMLKAYVMKTGDLPPVPSACTTEADRKLSIWVQEMKSLHYSKSDRIMNAPHRIEALESLGIEWVESTEDRWTKMFNRLAAYKRQHKDVTLPSFMQCRKSRDKDLIALRHWVDSQGQQVKAGSLSMEKLKKLQELGLPLELTWDQKWKYYMVKLLKFRSKFGHLHVSGEVDSDINEFVTEVCNRLKKGSEVKLTKDEMQDLRVKGLFNDIENVYKNPVGRPAANGSKGGVRLVPLDRVKEVNYWAGMFEQLKAYHEATGTFDPPLGKQKLIPRKH